jgi:hypothetical protein
MTDREFTLWSAVYASAWFHASVLRLGHVTDEERAAVAAEAADRALAALRGVRPEAVA